MAHKSLPDEIEDRLAFEEHGATSLSLLSEQQSDASSLDRNNSYKDWMHRQTKEQWHRGSLKRYRPRYSSLRFTMIMSLSLVLAIVLSMSTGFTVMATIPFLDHVLHSSLLLSQSRSSCLSSNAVTTSSTLQHLEKISCRRESPSSDPDCVFDPILLSWLPRTCVDFKLLNSTLNSSSPLAQPPYNIGGSFQVYADTDLSQPLSLAEVAELNQSLYHVTLGFHRTHCAYMLMLASNAASKRAAAAAAARRDAIGDQVEVQEHESTYVWRESVDPVHIDHCVKVLASRKGDLGNTERFQAGVGECVLLL